MKKMNTKIIKIKMIEKNISQKEIAKKLNINEQTISNWINGKNLENIKKFLTLIKELEIDIKQLF